MSYKHDIMHCFGDIIPNTADLDLDLFNVLELRHEASGVRPKDLIPTLLLLELQTWEIAGG